MDTTTKTISVETNKIVICLGGAATEIGNEIVNLMQKEGEIKKEKKDIIESIERWINAAKEEIKNVEKYDEKRKKIEEKTDALQKIIEKFKSPDVDYFDVKDEIDKQITELSNLGIKPKQRVIEGYSSKIADIKEEERELLRKGVSIIAIDTNPPPSNINSSMFHIELTPPARAICQQAFGACLNDEYWPSESGAGMRRIAGKEYFVVNKGLILESIRKRATQLVEETGRRNFFITILTAAGGGTGSGMFPDLAMMIRNDFPEQFKADSLMMVGIVTLPLPHEAFQLANAYGLLNELHFLLSSNKLMFNVLFIADRKEIGDSPEAQERFTPTIADFIRHMSFVPQETVKASGKKGAFDIADFSTYTTGVLNFSTFSYYRVIFPYRKLKWFYALSDVLKEEKETYNTESYEYKEANDNLQNLKDEIEKEEGLIKNLEEKLKQTEKDIFSKLHSSKIKTIKDKLESEKSNKKRIEEKIYELETRKIPDCKQKLYELQKEIEKTEKEIETTLKELNNGSTTLRTRTIELSNDEINKLKGKIENSWFRKIMQDLNRENEYLELTHRPISNANALFNPLLDYVHSNTAASGAGLSPEELREIKNYSLLSEDKNRHPIVETAKCNFYLALVSSDSRNIISEKLQIEDLKAKAMEYVASKAEVKLLTAPSPYEFIIYGLLFGISFAPISPGKPSRLRTMNKYKDMYYRTQMNSRIQHHSLFFITYQDYERLAGKIVDSTNLMETNREILNFWKNYQMLSPEEKWYQLPPTLAMVRVLIKNITTTLNNLEIKTNNFKQLTEGTKIEKEKLPGVVINLERIQKVLDETSKNVNKTNNDFSNSVEMIKTLSSQLEASRIPSLDPRIFENMRKMANETRIDDVKEMSNKIYEMLISKALSLAINDIENSINSIEEKDSLVIRKKDEAQTYIKEINNSYNKLKEGIEQLRYHIDNMEGRIKEIKNVVDEAASKEQVTERKDDYGQQPPNIEPGGSGTGAENYM